MYIGDIYKNGNFIDVILGTTKLTTIVFPLSQIDPMLVELNIEYYRIHYKKVD